jgi:hypothetical protein
MFFKTHRAMKRARRSYELARLRSEMAANQERLRELEALRNSPCPACIERGWARA